MVNHQIWGTTRIRSRSLTFLRSLVPRGRILILFRRREKSLFFFVKTANWLPLLVFPGVLVTRFTRSSPHGKERVTSLGRSAWEAMYVFSWFSTVWRFPWTGFSHWLHSTKKRMQSNVEWVFGRVKTNYFTAKHVYTRRFVRDLSFLEVLILDRA